MKKQPFGIMCLVICAIIWGAAFVAIRVGAGSVEPFTYSASRLLLGAAALAAFIAVNPAYRGRRHIDRQLVKNVLMCAAAYTVAVNLQQIGMAETTAGKGGFIAALYILVVPLIEMAMGKKVGLSIWIGVLVALGGLCLLCLDTDSLSFGRGDLFVLLSAVFYGLHIIIIDRCVTTSDPTMLSCGQFVIAGVVSLIIALCFESTPFSAIWGCRGTILYAGVLSCGVAHTLQMVGQKYTKPTQATLVLSLESPFAALSGFFLLNESLSLRELAGCALIFAAIFIGQFGQELFKRKAKA